MIQSLARFFFLVVCAFAVLWTQTLSGRALADDSYTVRSGDTLGGIAIKVGCESSLDLKRENRLKSDAIKVGQVIKVPPTCGAPSAKTLSATTASASSPPAIKGKHTVKTGETLGSIAIKYGCASSADLKHANHLKSDAIRVGQVINVSTCASSSASSASSASSTPRHTVREGQTLGGIASKYGCVSADLKRENRLKSDAIKVGQILIIPECSASSRPSSAPPTVASRAKVNTDVLPDLMAAHGFKPPAHFKAFVIEVTFNKTRTDITRERYFDYNGTSDDVEGWNPASTVKIFGVIAAVQRVRELGFSHKAEVTYHTAKGDRTFSLDEMITMTLVNSNNLTHNRMVQLASHDRLNARFLVPSNGFRRSAITGAYQTGDWTAQGESKSLATSPSITLKEKTRTETLKAHTGTSAPSCGGSACTSLKDLGEAMRRLMLQEQLPANQTFNLHDDDLKFIRQTMRAERSRGNEVVDAFADVFDDSRVLFYSKPGFAGNWFSDNVYIFDPTSNQAWIVVMAGSPGRKSLDSAAKIIAQIIAKGELKAVR